MSAEDQLTNAVADIKIIADIMQHLQDSAGNTCHKADLLLRNLKLCAANAEASTKELFKEMDSLEAGLEQTLKVAA